MIVLRKKNELSVGPPSTNVQTTKAQFHSMCLLRYCHLTMDEKVQRSPMHPYSPHMLPPLFSTTSPMWHIHMMNQSTVWKSTLCIVYSWKNLVHEFGSIYRRVSAVMLLYCWFHSRLSMLWPLTDFFSLCPWCRMVFFREICLLQTPLIIASLHLLFTWGDSESWRWKWFLLTGLDGYRGWS